MSKNDAEDGNNDTDGHLKDVESNFDMTRPDSLADGPDWPALIMAARFDDDAAWDDAVDKAEVHHDLERYTAALLDRARQETL